MPALSRQLVILSACVSVLLCASACGKKSPEQPATNSAQATPPAVTNTTTNAATNNDQAKPAEQTAAATTAGEAADGDEGAGRPPAPPLPVEQVKAVAQAWLDAQNRGDFEAYSKTYATKFFGIKRVGQRTASYTREGWLKDRERMFKKKMIVSIDAMSVTTSSQSAAVRFVQTWASGTFKDVGPKQLVIVREADGSLKIAREEMLASSLVNTAAEAAMDPALLSLIVREDKAKYLAMVLDPSVKKTPGAGPHRLLSRGRTTARSVATAQVPEAWRGWVGQEVVLYGAEAEACRATVAGFDYFVSVYPHFGQLQDWSGEMGGKKASASTVARGLWELGQGYVRLVARLKPAGECKGALWARLASKPAPTLYHQVANTESSTRHAEAATRKLPFMTKLQRQYAQEGGKGFWLSDAGTSVRHFAPKTGATQSIITVSGIDGDGCGAFRGEFWSAWRATPETLGKPELLTSPTAPGGIFVPATAADVDGDGKPELISHHQLARQRGAIWSVILDIEPPSFDCPC